MVAVQLHELLAGVDISSESESQDRVAAEDSADSEGEVNADPTEKSEPSSVVPFPVEKEVQARDEPAADDDQAIEIDLEPESDRSAFPARDKTRSRHRLCSRHEPFRHRRAVP